MPYDVVIVGAGPAGLAAAIKLKQLANAAEHELSVCVLEKGSEVGAHILSGAVFDPKGLDELIPEWREGDTPPLQVKVTSNQHWVLTTNKKLNMPNFFLPSFMHNENSFTGSLANLCRWLAGRAEELGVEIFPGFAAAEVLFNDDGSVKGVATGDMGVARDGTRKPDYTPGMEIHARYTFLAEGVRGHLSKEIMRIFDLQADCQPQVYGLGIKELWDIDPAKHVPGTVIHTQGWPLTDAWGGGWIYHQANNQVSIGFVTALSYKNPHLSPFEEMQRWKQHPAIRPLLEGGRRVAYGARAINEGGWQSIPKLAFPGGALIGCAAGFVNVPRIKGSHTAIKSGMLAAEAAFEAIRADRANDVLETYEPALRSSWIADELKTVKNAEPLVAKFGGTIGTPLAGMDMWLRHLGLRLPLEMKHHPDHVGMHRADVAPKINYPKPDGVISFDKLSSVYLSNVNHEEDQPIHLTLRDASRPTQVNLPLYDGPEQRYCPAGVYEYVQDEGSQPRLQINAQNCVHCKTCDIKDMTQNIKWVVPEGGGGPNYPNM